MRYLMLLLCCGLMMGCAAEPANPQPGTEGEPCYGNGTCNEPLTCMGGYCIPLDTSPSTSDTVQGADSAEPLDTSGPMDVPEPNDGGSPPDVALSLIHI